MTNLAERRCVPCEGGATPLTRIARGRLAELLVLFGGAQLPKMARNLGQAQRELKKAMEEGKSDDKPSDQK